MTIDELITILLSDKPSISIKENEDSIFKMIPKLKLCKNFNQNNDWHIYDVYEHILHVVDGVDCDIELRLSALFHDIGKPITYIEGADNKGHFYGHWVESKKIFDEFISNYKLDEKVVQNIQKLIYFHDVRFELINNSRLEELLEAFSDQELLKKLFNLKRADLLAQNSEIPKYNTYLSNLDKYENMCLDMIKSSNHRSGL